MYKKAFARRIGGNKHLIHLWTDTGYEKVEWTNFAYKQCPEGEGDYIGLNGESLKKQVNGILMIQDSIFICLLYTSPSPRDRQKSRMPSSA